MRIERQSYQTPVVFLLVVLVVLSSGYEAFCVGKIRSRTIINLDGTWELAQGSMDSIPEIFAHQISVPGLIDMANPPFVDVGRWSPVREAFWYRRIFNVDRIVPETALLKIYKAKYGTRVFLNGQHVGDHFSCFTPAVFDVRPYLRGSGAANELLIRVGAFRDAVPRTVPTGGDYEKTRYLPGIYDSVELILSGSPHIVRVQTVPDVSGRAVRVVGAVHNNSDEAREVMVTCKVREVATGTVVASGLISCFRLKPDQQKMFDLRMQIKNCRLWSPEDPFLYELEAATGSDAVLVRFGMRSFQFDKETGHAILNGRPYFLRGTNVCIFRFFDDPVHGDRPWREEWVRRLHRKFRSMHWNSIRYCIGFPPEMWYRIADEEGLLIQDEYPIWGDSSILKSDQLIKEYTEWIHERCNHPCVVIWDACNETKTLETGRAIRAVRGLDLSNRPWDNGWGEPIAPNDCREWHAYFLGNPYFHLPDLATYPKIIQEHPTIVNEYCLLWLNRDGTPASYSKGWYPKHLGPCNSTARRRQTYASYLAAMTEFLRCQRTYAGILQCFGLGYSRPGGATSDNFVDIEGLTLEPNFETYIRDAFSPVGVMIGQWPEDLPGGAAWEFPVTVINDLYEDDKGTVNFRIMQGNRTLFEQSKACTVRALGRYRLLFKGTIPSQPEWYQLVAELITEKQARPVRSRRDFEVLSAEECRIRHGLSYGKTAAASSSQTIDGVRHLAENVVDGQRSSHWVSDPSDPQWIAVDLGGVVDIARVKLLWALWGGAYGQTYAIQVSNDGNAWKDIYKTQAGDGGVDDIRLAATPARWVRLLGEKRSSPAGYCLSKFQVFTSGPDMSEVRVFRCKRDNSANKNGNQLGKVWRPQLIISDGRVDAIAYLGNGVAVAGTRTPNPGRIFKSTDYGKTWVDKAIVTGSTENDDITAIASAGGGVSYLITANTHVWKSCDYGDSWIDLGKISNNSHTEGAVLTYGLVVTNKGTVLASDTNTAGGHIFRSTDGGHNWTDLGKISDRALYRFEKVGDGIIVNGWAGRTYKSTNDGVNWVDKGQLINSPLFATEYLGNGIILQAAQSGNVFRSTDNGETWLDLGVIGDAADDFVYLGNGITVYTTYSGSNSLYYSADYGLTWSNIGSPRTGVSGDWFDHVIYIDDNGNRIGLGGTNKGYILRSQQ